MCAPVEHVKETGVRWLRTVAVTPETLREEGSAGARELRAVIARDPVPWYLQETPYRGGSE